MRSRNLIAVGVVVAVLAGSGIVFALVSFLPSQDVGPQAPGPANLKPHILGNQTIVSLSGVQLTVVARSETGNRVGENATLQSDNGHAMLTLSRAVYSNGSQAIVETVTNIGHVSVNVTTMIMGGADENGTGNSRIGTEQFNSYVIGCTGNSTITAPVINVGNGTTSVSSELYHIVCSQVAVQQAPVVLMPGQSFSAYVLVGSSVTKITNQIGGSAGYAFESGGAVHSYTIQVGFVTGPVPSQDTVTFLGLPKPCSIQGLCINATLSSRVPLEKNQTVILRALFQNATTGQNVTIRGSSDSMYYATCTINGNKPSTCYLIAYPASSGSFKVTLDVLGTDGKTVLSPEVQIIATYESTG
ncbi:MAG: hypothetical protein JRM99_01105 [Nitrososphaerota archaeon]|nr:hypothetical protein [Nitrososphaerota archaeon]